MAGNRIRCPWSEGVSDSYLEYHDTEWGVPVRDDRRQFEFLLLEGAQAGLSWSTILHRREGYRRAFADFDPVRVARFTPARITKLLADPGIIRNRLKLRTARQNAQAWLTLEDPVALLWSFVGGAPKINHFSGRGEVPAVTPEAEAMSKALKKLGFTFVGPTICYAYMQAAGMVMDHTTDCDRYHALRG